MLLHKEISDKIIKAFYNVYNSLGYGLTVQRQVPIKVFYEEQLVGEYFADIIVEGNIIVELKATENLCETHEFQLINYLKATELEIGLLLNFGKKPQFRRKIFTN